MKKIFYILLVTCAMVACSKDDGYPTQPDSDESTTAQNNIAQLSALLNTSWSETRWINFKYYDEKDNLIKEDSFPEEEGAPVDGPTYAICLTKDFIGWWIPTGLNGPTDKPYTYGTTKYEFSQEGGILKIGEIVCDLHNFTAEYIEFSYTAPTDKGYCVRRIRLTPVTEQKTWDEWVAKFKAENGE